MGKEAIYKCNQCNNEFESNEGGGFKFIEYRCVNCDKIKPVKNNRKVQIKKYKPPTKKEIGVCEECQGKLKDNLKPMCPACSSRDVKEIKVLKHYD